jgi:hypothetical protein
MAASMGGLSPAAFRYDEGMRFSGWGAQCLKGCSLENGVDPGVIKSLRGSTLPNGREL